MADQSGRRSLLREHPVALAPPWILTVIFAAAWAGDLYPAEPVWGSIAEWFAGVATASGLIFAAQQIRHANRQHRDAQEDARLFQSRAVAIASWVDKEAGRWRVSWEVKNSSDQPVFNVVVLILDPNAVVTADYVQNTALVQVYIGTVLARGDRIGSQLVELSAAPTLGAETRICALLFSDSWDQHWIRRDRKALSRQAAAVMV